MIISASQIYTLRVMGEEIPPLNPNTRLSLQWPRWYPLTAEDRQKDAQTLVTLVANGQLSRETAIKTIASAYDI